VQADRPVVRPRRLVPDVRADDFARLRAGFPKHWSPVTVAGRVNRCRAAFNFQLRLGTTAPDSAPGVTE
jgi:hypothetical protein